MKHNFHFGHFMYKNLSVVIWLAKKRNCQRVNIIFMQIK